MNPDNTNRTNHLDNYQGDFRDYNFNMARTCTYLSASFFIDPNFTEDHLLVDLLRLTIHLADRREEVEETRLWTKLDNHADELSHLRFGFEFVGDQMRVKV